MENSPLNIENDSDDDSSKKKKSKRAGRLGAIVVEPKSEDRSDAALSDKESSHESFWHRLTHREETETADDHDAAVENSHDDLAETDTAADLENFTEADRQYAETELARGHRHALSQEFSSIPDDPEAARSLEAELMALEAFYDRIAVERTPLEEAFNETLHDMDVAPESVQVEMPESAAMSDERPAENRSWKPFAGEHTTSAKEQAAEAAGVSPPEKDLDVADTHGSGNIPPDFPPQSQGYGGGNVPRPPEYFVGGAGQTNHANHLAPSGASAESGEPRYTRANVVGAALVGGIVGYLIGRRRGRIKTEKKLLPVQKKLEKAVSSLENDMFRKEIALRKVAREQQDQQKVMDRLKRRGARQEQQLATADRQREQSAEQPVVMARHVLEKVRAPALEANQLHGKKLPPERIGKVLMSAERPTLELNKKTEWKDRPISGRPATMGRHELMAVSEKIAVNNTNLRRIYESHLVGEQGLRRLVEAHMRGGDIQKVLQQEMLEHQIDFERDPVMRDYRPQQEVTARQASSAALDRLLSRTGFDERSEEHEDRAVLQARAVHQAAEAQKSIRRRRGADAAFAGTILILIAVIILLLISR